MLRNYLLKMNLPRNDDEYVDEGDDEYAELNETVNTLHDVLSITAQKLKHVTMGRGFTSRPGGGKSSGKGRPFAPGSSSGPPQRETIESRKARTTCAICGELGHWQGDPECKKGSSTSKPPFNKTVVPPVKLVSSTPCRSADSIDRLPVDAASSQPPFAVSVSTLLHQPHEG